ncbi:MAG: helix-turn-helix domain-containing protein [Lachnospiraceae bacterium]|nr:helix-turn-helix domain-containing protein [Lachnospiraceae bacterium]
MIKSRKKWLKEHLKQLTANEYTSFIRGIHTETLFQARDDREIHGTWRFEQRMLDLVRRGAVRELEQFLIGSVETENLHEGIQADSELRQAKNLFIGLVTMVGKSAAIPGGMGVEDAYYLIDIYILECEKMTTAEEVFALQYNMIIDFASRIARLKYQPPLSYEIRRCIEYIEMHLNDSISTQDVITFSGLGRTALCSKFKTEIGVSIGRYITEAKVKEAESLLTYTDKTLGEISSYLGFSSQPYFQNVFKKITGTSPGEYRRITVPMVK